MRRPEIYVAALKLSGFTGATKFHGNEFDVSTLLDLVGLFILCLLSDLTCCSHATGSCRKRCEMVSNFVIEIIARNCDVRASIQKSFQIVVTEKNIPNKLLYYAYKFL